MSPGRTSIDMIEKLVAGRMQSTSNNNGPNIDNEAPQTIWGDETAASANSAASKNIPEEEARDFSLAASCLTLHADSDCIWVLDRCLDAL